MTDPELADRTYVEPITPEFVEKVIERERPDALLPTLGGQTGLNTAVDLAKSGVLEQVRRRDDRRRPRRRSSAARTASSSTSAMDEIGLETARSGYAYSVDDAAGDRRPSWLPRACCARASPWAARAAASLMTRGELRDRHAGPRALAGRRGAGRGIDRSAGKNIEMEVMRDRAGNGIIICSIENVDPMGVHTGDSITVAPAQTLSDMEYQRMRVASLAILREIGVETGGSNVQFAVNPENGRLIVIEMNPRVSRVRLLWLEGDGLPHRQGRGASGRRLYARRDRPTTSRARRRRASSPLSITASSRCRVLRSRSSRAPTTRCRRA